MRATTRAPSETMLAVAPLLMGADSSGGATPEAVAPPVGRGTVLLGYETPLLIGGRAADSEGTGAGTASEGVSGAGEGRGTGVTEGATLCMLA